MKTHLTPFQLFFVTFLYVFSGITLAGADSVLALLLPFACCVLWALVGYRGAMKKRDDLADLLSVYLPKKETVIPLAFFLIVTVSELLFTLFNAGNFFEKESDFLPFPLVLAVLFGIAAVIAFFGVTALGRFAETVLFLLVPLIVLHLFGRLDSIPMIAPVSDLKIIFSVMPAPIFFLLAMTTVSGDEGTSDAFRIVYQKPKDRAGFLMKTVIGGAGLAVLLRTFLLLFPFRGTELLLYFLEYSAHAAKLAILLSLLVYGPMGMGRRFSVFSTALISFSAVLTLAILGGAVFSPFLWMLLLISTSAAVMGMLGIFSLKT